MHPQLHKSLSPFKSIVFVGGWTGWHISPIIALHEELSHNKSLNFHWIWGRKSTEENEARKNNISFSWISILKLSTTKSLKILLYPFYLLLSFFEARKILKNIKKDNDSIVIFSKGWPGSLAIGMAWKSLNIPLFIHESDTIPWRSNSQLAYFADIIFLWFECSKKFFQNKKCITIGQILDQRITKTISKNIWWKTHKPHVLVFCGSQWARSIFMEIAKNCQNIDVEWMIVLWKLNTQLRNEFSHFKNIQILDWLEKENQNYIFQNTDIAITRWSATTLAELQLFDIKKIIIPLPDAAKNHQFFNTKEYEKQGDILLEQKHISKLWKILQWSL